VTYALRLPLPGPACSGPGLGVLLLLAVAGCGSPASVGERSVIPDGASKPADARKSPIRVEPSRLSIALADFSDVRDITREQLSDEDWKAILTVRVGAAINDTAPDAPAVLGSCSVAKGTLVFEPRFPFRPGLRYNVSFDARRLPGTPTNPQAVYFEGFMLPKPEAAATTVVEAVYPSRKLLPENQLKFYLHFSAPMSRGQAYSHIKLLDAAGKVVNFPFLDLDEELWDPAGKRFTLFFDPGRIKRGLKPREELGPPLEDGKSYTLVVDRQWSDAAGNPLKESFRKAFTVGPPDDEAVEPKTWKIAPPAAGKAGELVVRFPKSMDHALLHRMLWVNDATGKTVDGTIAVGDEETTWRFKPALPWQVGKYHLVADTAFEDLSGNSIGRPFEVDVFRPVGSDTRAKTVQIPFEIMP
jgi:hypothetical protein